ncbi:MAG: hypothetical protein NT124_04855 [Candidatus Dependentiae bacterium]|nr:hypothetical protein [Candidatus Dependentiae bacterium]
MKCSIVKVCIILIAYCMPTAVFCVQQQSQKIRIITSTSNHPEFIAYQDKAFKKFLKDEYEFIVFNDAFDAEIANEIDRVCSLLHIACIRVPQENRIVGTVFSWGSYRHGQAIEYMMKTVGFDYDGIVVLIDSDLFPIKNFCVTDFLAGYDCAGLRMGPQGGTMDYMWPGLLFLRMNALPNKETMSFLPADKEWLDTGGSFYHYLHKNSDVKKLFFKQKTRFKLDTMMRPYYLYDAPYRKLYIHCPECIEKESCIHTGRILRHFGFRDDIIQQILLKKIPGESEFLLGDTFFHLSNSSGYHKIWQVQEREARMRNFMNYILSDM